MHLIRSLVAFSLLTSLVWSQQPTKDVFIPRRQEVMPGPALSPAEAIKKMEVPAGFKVELVAAEPDLVNPVAMTFDERGRVWITESFEYPRKEPGPGRDRVKTLEDTDGDGTLDKVTVFAEGLNIPSGIAVGYGGVWVANAPDILFMQDTDGDGKADKQEVVVTGFGRFDTHELPNSLTWGPDGWLYGLNGVFNPSKIVHRGQTHEFTCAMFRIHPRTRAFEVFCEGTSNPWGIAIDKEGSFFVSACVIDHLWHLVETGYYHRQGGPYPPHTWKIESIVKHKHQLAAYCGIHYYDSDAYPPQYREKLYMGNVHGNCINSDRLERDGSTYRGLPEPDFLKANDAWFMPVVQKTGPDGCLWILDWYDRYHCYQDANRDPAGIDRGHGRLYRVRYQDTPRAPKFDLSQETDEQLIERLKSPNGFFRDIAQRVLAERANPETVAKLVQVVEEYRTPYALHALYAAIGSGKLDRVTFNRLANHKVSTVRAWAIRSATDQLCYVSSKDISPDVLLQRVIASGKQGDLGDLLDIANASDDPHLGRVLWRNIERQIPKHLDAITKALATLKLQNNLATLFPRLMNRLAFEAGAEEHIANVLRKLWEKGALPDPVLAEVFQSIGSQAISGERDARPFKELASGFMSRTYGEVSIRDLQFAAGLIVAAAGDDFGLKRLAAIGKKVIQDYDRGTNSALTNEQRARLVRCFEGVIAGKGTQLNEMLDAAFSSETLPETEMMRILTAVGRTDDASVAERVVTHYSKFSPTVQPVAIELLTQRDYWSHVLVQAVEEKKIPREGVNVNQLRKLLSVKDPEFVKRVTAIWGTVRTERNPQREQVVAQMRELVKNNSGDPHKGVAVFHKLCGQCHKIHGQGQDVGPDITVNGRASIDQLLSNVFDPSLVIGQIYQAYTVVTSDGRTLTGLVVENNPQRVVLKVQGGKIETIARKDIDELAVSKLSLMPEGVGKQLSPEELRDLLAFLVLDKAPSDPAARMIPDVSKK